MDRCPDCGANLALVGVRHRCIPRDPPKKHGADRRTEEAATRSPKRGRPRIEDRGKSVEARKPWVAAGMSRATWYARQAEKRVKV